MKYKELIGLPQDQAIELLGDEKYEIINFSRPDKFHTDIQASFRVVKIEREEVLKIYVAGFADKIGKV